MRMRLFAALLIALSAIVMPAPGHALRPDELLADPKLEARARDLSLKLRCLVCQNQSIDDSDAPLARDLRVLVRERLSAGDSDAQVLEFLVKRYGEFVLLTPPLKTSTILLWASPFAVLILAGGLLLMRARRRVEAQSPASGELNADEVAKLSSILDKKSP